MARNEEKAQSMLNRWLELKKGEAAPERLARRPGMTTDCNDLTSAERWRGQVLRELGKRVNEIQNSSLPEKRIRELNDTINKLIKEKVRWERRIMDLGGANHFASSNKVRDEDGTEIVGGGKGDYKYFGAAKQLPEVKNLLQQQSAFEDGAKKGKRAHDLHKGLDADYYGFRDDDDGVLEKAERVQENKRVSIAQKQWAQENPGKDPATLAADELAAEASTSTETLKTTMALPTREEIEAALLEKRKEDVLQKYTKPAVLNTLLDALDRAPAAEPMAS